MTQIESEDAAPYGVDEDAIIKQAREILKKRAMKERYNVTTPTSMKEYLLLNLSERQHEVFGMVLLTVRHDVISITELFRGTIDGSSVYPREVLKEVLLQNAAAVVFYHNHPSGEPVPSMADRNITSKLKEALALVDVRVLDHLIIGGAEVYSFVENGLM